MLQRYIRKLLRLFQLQRRGVSIGYDCELINVNFSNADGGFGCNNSKLEPHVRIIGDPIIEIGTNCYFNVGCHFLGEIHIGNDVLIGPQVIIWGRDHGIDRNKLIRLQEHKSAPIIIEDDVWIGANSVILKGVTIGKGSVVGAGSVVLKDIPPMSVAVGNPAKVIKKR